MPVVSLEVPKLPRAQANSYPSINTDTFFEGSNYTTCSAVSSLVNNAGSSANVMTSLKISDVLSNLTQFRQGLADRVWSTVDVNAAYDLTDTNHGGGVANYAAGPSRGWPEIDAYLSKLENQSLLYYRLVRDCARETSSSTASGAQAATTYADQVARTDESKARLESIKDPEQKTSYYEGWFPLFRPMTETTLFILFGTALLLLLLSMLIFLNTRGVTVAITFPEGGLGLPLPEFSGSGPYVGGGLAVGVLGGYLVYRYVFKQ